MSDNNIRPLSRHDEYYISSADLFILVEQVQFRVHRYFFERESKWFGGRLEAPASPGAKLLGSDDSTAIVLDELSSDDFAKFLWVFYNKTYSLYEAPVEDWEIILTLSNQWSFPRVKDLAIRELEKKYMSDVKRIKLYKENHVDLNYLIPCYAALCEREEPLTAEEGMDLGMMDVIQIAAAREQARSSFLPSGARSPLSPTIRGTDLHEVIRAVFHIAPLETVDETTNIITGDPNHTTTDSKTTIGTETTGDQKTNGHGNGAATENGDPSKTGGDSNANSNQNHSGSTTTPTPTVKGNNNADVKAKGGNNSSGNSKNKNKNNK